jgi:thiol-disulfide isomerase/thioredoxin
MKSLRISILLFAILLCVGQVIGQPAPEKFSKPVPDFAWNAEIKGFGEAPPFHLSDDKGKVILLVAWASWCRPCINGLNELVKIREEFAGQDLAIVGISIPYSFDDDRQRAIDFVQQSGFKFKMGWINNGVGSLLNSDSAYVPNFMLITGDGVMVERILGFNPNKTPKLLREEIKRLLKGGPALKRMSGHVESFEWKEAGAVKKEQVRSSNERFDECVTGRS